VIRVYSGKNFVGLSNSSAAVRLLDKCGIQCLIHVNTKQQGNIMKLNAYLSFDGHCEEAFNFYAEKLGAEITAMMMFSDGPPEATENLPNEWRSKIMHACLKLGDYELMGTDGMGACPSGADADAGISGAHVVLQVDEPGDAERIYTDLSTDGTVQMAMEQTFFARRFGMVVDRFGVPWMVLCE